MIEKDPELPSQIKAKLDDLLRAIQPEASFASRLRAELLAKAENMPGKASSPGGVRLQRAWQWGLGLAGLALLVGVLVFSIGLLPEASLSPAGTPSVQAISPAPGESPTPVHTPALGVTPAAAGELQPTPTVPQTYTVQAGDTWASIAARFGVSVADMLAWNGMSDVSELHVGQTLAVGRLSSTPQPAEGGNEPSGTPAPGPAPKALAPGACPIPVGDILDPNLFPSLGDPLSGLAGGGQVQSGRFTIDRWLACAPEDGETSSPYTLMPGLGVAMVTRYSGPGIDGNAEDFAGIEPFVRRFSVWGPIKASSASSGWDGLSSLNVIPDLSRQDTPLRYVYKIRVPDGAIYGAALSFVLRREANGYRPVEVRVAPLSQAELQSVETAPGTALPFPTLEPEDVYPELQELRAILDPWQPPLLAQPGWGHIAYDVYDPANGLYDPLTKWVREDWYQIDAQGMVIAYVFRDRTEDGRILQQSHAVWDRSVRNSLCFDSPFIRQFHYREIGHLLVFGIFMHQFSVL